MLTHVNVLTGKIIGAAIEVHRALGPGLLESAYHQCLAREFRDTRNSVQVRLALAVGIQGVETWKGVSNGFVSRRDCNRRS